MILLLIIGFHLMLAKGDSEFLLGTASEATSGGDAHHDEAAGVPDQVGISGLTFFNFQKTSLGRIGLKFLTFLLFSRLTEARAKMELREEATKEDAEEVINHDFKDGGYDELKGGGGFEGGDLWQSQVVEIMRSSMIDTFSDDIGQLDFSRSTMG